MKERRTEILRRKLNQNSVEFYGTKSRKVYRLTEHSEIEELFCNLPEDQSQIFISGETCTGGFVSLLAGLLLSG